ncbi:hypothetical protein JW921_11270 [Candidatus Fermentibacterales bacterium]|nr:hypothetical protein [Candidatus Fermentibacterales bacterium]
MPRSLRLSAVLVLLAGPALASEEIPILSAVLEDPGAIVGSIGQDWTSTRYGQPWLLMASSGLPDYGTRTYTAGNLMDGELETAWVEGVPGSGLGEMITIQAPLFEDYLTDDQVYNEEGDPGIDTMPWPLISITILNGYQASQELWEANERVKTLLVDLNGRILCTMELEDTMLPQTFDLYELQEALGPDCPALVLDDGGFIRFEIVDVYPGTLYEDTAISEILLIGGQG